MPSNKYLSLLIILISFTISAQNTTFLGSIKAKDNLESIHVINKTQKKYTTSNKLGVFKIEAQVNDTIVFSSVQYLQKTITITQQDITNKTLNVTLIEYVNELQEVIVGNTLTGNLQDDIKTMGTKRGINFYDLGIKGYTGKPKTQPERRLHEATTGGGILPLNPIINAITGRTKKLKKQIALQENKELLQKVKSEISEDFFSNNSLDEEKKMDFLYFCSDDKAFAEKCTNNRLKCLQFIEQKYLEYKENLTTKK